MKRHLSVFMLAARSSVYKVLLLICAMAAGEWALFSLALGRMTPDAPLGLEQVVAQSRISWVWTAALLALCAILSLTGCGLSGSRVSYTISRLSVGEKVLTVWWAAYNFLCLLALWAAQALTALALCLHYTALIDPAYLSGQTIFLAFYRQSFLHSILPLADTTRLACVIVLFVCLGICAACFSFRVRRGYKGVAVVLLSIFGAATFSRNLGGDSGDALVITVTLAVTASAVYGLWREADQDE